MKKNYQELPFSPLFYRFIIDSKTGRRLTASGKKISKGTVEQYEITYKLILDFEAQRSLQLRIKILGLKGNQVFNSEKRYWKKFYALFSDWLYKRGYYDQYVGSVAKILRTVFNYQIKERGLLIGNFHQQFKMLTNQPIPIVLEPVQLKYLITNTFFRESLTLKLDKTNDIFIFGCSVGLRFSDMMKLKKADLEYSKDVVYILVHTNKTGKLVKIPLPKYVLVIIEKYQTGSSKYLLPRISNTHLNKNIKELMAAAGWTYQLPKISFCRGKSVHLKNSMGTEYRFCDHITAHTMRRTAITTLLLMGVEENIVRSISGHAPGSKEFYKYVGLVQTQMNRQVLGAFDKLLTEE